MGTLGIKGHATRGKEVIEILEKLGGKNTHNYIANCESLYFHIGSKINNIYYGWLNYPKNSDMVIFTLEEFLEKFPYKVGDKVLYHERMSEIISMKWEDNDVVYTVLCKGTKWETVTNFLQPYIEQIEKSIENSFKETNEVIFDTNAQCCDIRNKIIQKKSMKTITQLIPILDKDTNEILYYTDENTGINYAPMNETTLHLIDGYELVDENGNVINAKTVTLTKKQPKCPKTYEECRNVLLLKPERATYSVSGLEYKRHLIVNFQELLICRDAYWKIAGNWKPDAMYCDLHCIGYDGNLVTWKMQGGSRLLAFPTEEMRDAFYENFKDLIEQCKELL